MIVHVPIDQASAGTTELIAAVPFKRIRVLNYVVVLAGEGTYAFSDGQDWHSGAIPVADRGGAAPNAGPNPRLEPHPAPLFACGVGLPLQITTVGGSAHGHLTAEIR